MAMAMLGIVGAGRPIDISRRTIAPEDAARGRVIAYRRGDNDNYRRPVIVARIERRVIAVPAIGVTPSDRRDIAPAVASP
jgi:hypothetical protein